MRITIENYRNIPFASPCTFSFENGITFILGANNVGKTNLIRLIDEFRPIVLKHHASNLQGNQEWQLDVPFDKVVNRKNRNSPIKLSFKDESNKCISYSLAPRSGDARSVNVYIELSGAARIADYHDLYKQVRDIFIESLVIGSLRTISTNSSGRSFDINIGSEFIRHFSAWSDGEDLDKIEEIKSLKVELAKLFGYKSFDIRLNDKRDNIIVHNDDGTFFIQEMGSGIVHFIVALSEAVMKKPKYIFCDEPETALHPKMQELFVRVLASKAANSLIATSHSIGLARSVADRIFSVKREEPDHIMIGQFNPFEPSIAQQLNELGYSQYFEVETRHLLIVEGKTDVKVFKEILSKYDIDDKVIVLPLGSQFYSTKLNKIETELKELSNMPIQDIFVVFDSMKTDQDSSLSNKLETFKQACEQLNFKVFATDLHSTENYISQSALDHLYPKQFQALRPFEDYSERKDSEKWSKDSNWRLFKLMKREELEKTELGLFIKNIILPSVNSRKLGIATITTDLNNQIDKFVD